MRLIKNGEQNLRSLDVVRAMIILTIAAVVIVIGWFALTARLWTSFKEDECVHPIYRSMMAHTEMERGKPVSHPKPEGCLAARIHAARAEPHGTAKQS